MFHIDERSAVLFGRLLIVTTESRCYTWMYNDVRVKRYFDPNLISTNCSAAKQLSQFSNIRNSQIYCVNRYFLMFCGSQGLSPTYEQAHVGLELLTLVSLYYFVTYYVKQKQSCPLNRLILRNRFHVDVDIWVKLW